ncbi:MAG: hypothetical protein JWR58_369, partial [Pseudonocardia sp.]|nr:hypothetical protein [Pseudonocardia sp.]
LPLVDLRPTAEYLGGVLADGP